VKLIFAAMQAMTVRFFEEDFFLADCIEEWGQEEGGGDLTSCQGSGQGGGFRPDLEEMVLKQILQELPASVLYILFTILYKFSLSDAANICFIHPLHSFPSCPGHRKRQSAGIVLSLRI
jgi:hypothetical protein